MKESRVAGDMRYVFSSYWNLFRDDFNKDNPPSLNANFIECRHSNMYTNVPEFVEIKFKPKIFTKNNFVMEKIVSDDLPSMVDPELGTLTLILV
jgi:hypothetical protein